MRLEAEQVLGNDNFLSRILVGEFWASGALLCWADAPHGKKGEYRVFQHHDEDMQLCNCFSSRCFSFKFTPPACKYTKVSRYDPVPAGLCGSKPKASTGRVRVQQFPLCCYKKQWLWKRKKH